MSIRTKEEFENIMQPIIAGILDFESKNVRIGWPTYGAPTGKIIENIVYLKGVPIDDDINRQIETEFEVSSPGLLQTDSATRVMSIQLTAYGPKAYDNLKLINLAIFDQSVLELLALQEIFLIPDIVEPRRLPEKFQDQWWERADSELRFNEVISREKNIGEIKSAEVVVYQENGDTTAIEISE